MDNLDLEGWVVDGDGRMMGGCIMDGCHIRIGEDGWVKTGDGWVVECSLKTMAVCLDYLN